MKNMQSSFKLRDKLSNLNINEVKAGKAAYIAENKIDKIFNSIVKIEINEEYGTGFLMKLDICGNQLRYLVTCHHVISKDDVDSKETIKIYYGKKEEEIEKEIKLDKNKRNIKCFDEPIDITLIGIVSDDCIPINKYLVPNFDFKKKTSGFKSYLKKNIYLAGYPDDDQHDIERVICSGKIKEIKDFEFSHELDTRSGSSGSPICLLDDTSIIGIHKGGIKEKKINYGTFIGIIINELEKKPMNNENKIIQNLISKEQYEKMMENNCAIRLGKLLTKFEIYSFKFGNNKNILKKDLIFANFFDKFGYQLNKSTRINLFDALKQEIELFKTELEEFLLKNKIFKIDNLSKEQLLEHIIKLRACLSEDTEKIIYNNLIKILEKKYEN